MTVVINARGPPGEEENGPKVLLKYIQAKPGDYVCVMTGEVKHLPYGYAIAKSWLFESGPGSIPAPEQSQRPELRNSNENDLRKNYIK